MAHPYYNPQFHGHGQASASATTGFGNNQGPNYILMQQLPFAHSTYQEYSQPSHHPNYNVNKGYVQSSANYNVNKGNLQRSANFIANNGNLQRSANFIANKGNVQRSANFIANKGNVQSRANYNVNKGYVQMPEKGRNYSESTEVHSQKRGRDSRDDDEYGKRQRLNTRTAGNAPDSINNQITEYIWHYYENNRQTAEIYKKKVHLRDALYLILKDIFPFCGLYMVGSSMSGFATKSSDMDLCLMISPDQLDGKKEAVEILMAIQRALRHCSFHKRSQLIRARVPILKFEDPQSRVECDLNINNNVGIRNTHLLRYYAAMDWRVRPLVLFVKKWARFHDINDASKKTISSYSFCLMVIHYLQCGTYPKVLDSVQKLNPTLFDYGNDIRNLNMSMKVNFKSKNLQSLGDLFLGFLEYYTLHFNFLYDVASVRQGTRLPIHLVRSHCNDQRQWGCLKIEEPFDLSNTARSCFDPETFVRVRRVITKSFNLLSTSRNVNSILTSPF